MFYIQVANDRLNFLGDFANNLDLANYLVDNDIAPETVHLLATSPLSSNDISRVNGAMLNPAKREALINSKSISPAERALAKQLKEQQNRADAWAAAVAKSKQENADFDNPSLEPTEQDEELPPSVQRYLAGDTLEEIIRTTSKKILLEQIPEADRQEWADQLKADIFNRLLEINDIAV